MDVNALHCATNGTTRRVVCPERLSPSGGIMRRQRGSFSRLVSSRRWAARCSGQPSRSATARPVARESGTSEKARQKPTAATSAKTRLTLGEFDDPPTLIPRLRMVHRGRRQSERQHDVRYRKKGTWAWRRSSVAARNTSGSPTASSSTSSPQHVCGKRADLEPDTTP